MATYTSAASGLWSADATWVGGVKPPSGEGHKIIIAAGHVVEFDEAAGEYGDDTSSTTAANNGIVVYGTLKASRSVSTSLTCRGTLMLATGGTVDWGSSADRIPAAVTATIVLNYSTSMSNGKHGMTSHGATSGTWNLGGKVRTRNTTLTAAATAGSNIAVEVADATGWEVGDQVVLESDNLTVSRANLTTISAVEGNVVTLAALNFARAAGCRIGNLASNVVVRAHTAANPAICAFVATPAGEMICTISQVRFENIGHTSGWAGASQNVPSYYGVGFAAGRSAQVVATSCAVVGTSAAQSAAVSLENLSAHPVLLDGWAIYCPTAPLGGVYWGNGGRAIARNCAIYGATKPYYYGYSAGSLDGRVEGGFSAASAANLAANAGNLTLVGVRLRSQAALVDNGFATTAVFEACDIDCASRLYSQGINSSIMSATLSQCTLSPAALTGNLTTGSVQSQSQRIAMAAVNGVAADNRDYSYWRVCDTDTTTRHRSTYAVRIQPKVANTAITYTFSLPAVAGVAQTIKGSLRFDATYGTATPPSIALSGQGATASFTAPATADAWHDFTLNFTPTSTGDITATVTVQSASTSGFAWLDGVYHYPMTQSVRHYGYQWLPQAAQIVDTRLTITETAALALPVVVDHDAETIAITGSATAREVFEHCVADLCQTANQGRAVHISSATGETFETTYTVVGTVVGPYTDATGLHTTITAASIVAGSRVQLYSVTDSTELLNTVLSSTGLNYATTWTADKTIRLRADHPDYLPLEATGILTASGLQFLAAQEADTVYIGNGIDGSTVTEFTADGLDIHVDVDDTDGYTLVQRLYAWLQHYQTTEAGIASAIFGAMTASDSANYQIDQDKADIHLDNVAASPLMIVGGYLTRKDGSTVIAATSGSIQMDPGRAYVAPGGAAITVPDGERVVTLAGSGAYFARG